MIICGYAVVIINEALAEWLRITPIHANEEYRMAFLKKNSMDKSWFEQHLRGVTVSLDTDDLQNYGTDWSKVRDPAPTAVLFPQHAEQVQQIVVCARKYGLALVPSGGRTGLSGGAIAADGELVLSLERMRALEPVCQADATIRVQAGVVTATVQQQAAAAGLFYGVDFAAAGSSQIGGNIATNAGGIRVLRYGLTRDQILGLEAVTGTGELLQLNHGLIKNATGYDLRHLLIGSEGTLAVITAATLKLWPHPGERQVLLLALDSHQALVPLFIAARQALALSAFEFFTHNCVRHVCAHAGLAPPLQQAAKLYVLLECDAIADDHAAEFFEQVFDQGLVSDGVISQSQQHAQQLWQYRERISESIADLRPYKNDIAVRIAAVPQLLQQLDELVRRYYPDFEVLWYGHIGDGNIHMNVLRPESMQAADFKRQCEQVNEQVFACIQQLGGSISAEHGVGLLKQPWLHYSRSGTEIELMRQIKSLLDPDGIMNPGKLLSS